MNNHKEMFNDSQVFSLLGTLQKYDQEPKILTYLCETWKDEHFERSFSYFSLASIFQHL